MPQNLTTPKVITETATQVEITEVSVNYERNMTVIKYNLLKEDGSLHSRGAYREEAADLLNVTALYSRVLIHIENE